MAVTRILRLTNTCFPLFRMIPTGEGRAMVQQLDKKADWVDVYADDSSLRAFAEMNRMMSFYAGAASVCAKCGGPMKDYSHLRAGAAYCSEACFPGEAKYPLLGIGFVLASFVVAVAAGCWFVGTGQDAWRLALRLLGAVR